MVQSEGHPLIRFSKVLKIGQLIGSHVSVNESVNWDECHLQCY